MPQASTLIRTDPAAGSGIGRSTISHGPFGRETWATRIVDMFRPPSAPVLTQPSSYGVAAVRHRPARLPATHPSPPTGTAGGAGAFPAGIDFLSDCLGRQPLQLLVEHGGDGGDLRIAE